MCICNSHGATVITIDAPTCPTQPGPWVGPPSGGGTIYWGCSPGCMISTQVVSGTWGTIASCDDIFVSAYNTQ